MQTVVPCYKMHTIPVRMYDNLHEQVMFLCVLICLSASPTGPIFNVLLMTGIHFSFSFL